MVVGHSVSAKSSRDNRGQVSWDSLGCPERKDTTVFCQSPWKATDFSFLPFPASDQCEFGRGHGNPQLSTTTNEDATTDTVLSQQCKDQGCHNGTGVQPTGALTLRVGVNSCKIWPSEDEELQMKSSRAEGYSCPPGCPLSVFRTAHPSSALTLSKVNHQLRNNLYNTTAGIFKLFEHIIASVQSLN